MMQAGTYYIGDLCYVLDESWDEFCNITILGEDVIDGEFQLKDGRKFATYCTAYGDGVYPASDGSKLGVDAGLIGCVLLNEIDSSVETAEQLGTIVTFDAAFETESRDGVIRFGHITVDTGCQNEFDDEENYNCWGDEEE